MLLDNSTKTIDIHSNALHQNQIRLSIVLVLINEVYGNPIFNYDIHNPPITYYKNKEKCNVRIRQYNGKIDTLLLDYIFEEEVIFVK